MKGDITRALQFNKNVSDTSDDLFMCQTTTTSTKHINEIYPSELILKKYYYYTFGDILP